MKINNTVLFKFALQSPDSEITFAVSTVECEVKPLQLMTMMMTSRCKSLLITVDNMFSQYNAGLNSNATWRTELKI